jgi:hypothetical protein
MFFRGSSKVPPIKICIRSSEVTKDDCMLCGIYSDCSLSVTLQGRSEAVYFCRVKSISQSDTVAKTICRMRLPEAPLGATLY